MQGFFLINPYLKLDQVKQEYSKVFNVIPSPTRKYIYIYKLRINSNHKVLFL
jgi:hypothetical protein